MWKFLFRRRPRFRLPKEVLAPETRPVIYNFNKEDDEKQIESKKVEVKSFSLFERKDLLDEDVLIAG